MTLARRRRSSLYVHLPWCVRKCPYCDFNSHAVPAAGLPERAYVEALLDDLEFAALGWRGRPLVSMFFGGGTPSLFSAASIGACWRARSSSSRAAADLEVTLEANPGTVERGRFAEYRDAGITRVSLGAQSFDDRRLAALGRIHSARRNAGRRGGAARRRPRQFQSRPDVRVAASRRWTTRWRTWSRRSHSSPRTFRITS